MIFNPKGRTHPIDGRTDDHSDRSEGNGATPELALHLAGTLDEGSADIYASAAAMD